MPHTASTVFAAFARAAQRWPDLPFICTLPETAAVYGIAAGEWRYAEMLERVQACSSAYAQAGYGHGHRVGLLLENRPSFFLHWFALNALGVSVVPLSADLRAAELEYLVGHSEITLVVVADALLDARRALLLAAAAQAGRALAVMAESDAAPPTACATSPLAQLALDEDTECALLYTSGTTGRPKGCILSNRYFLHAGRWYAQLGGLAHLRPGQERMLTPLPLVHMNAMACSTLCMVMTGGCLMVLDRFHPRTWWDSVRASRATVVHYLGVMPAMLMQAGASEDDQKHSVRFAFGAGVERGLHAAFEARFGFPLLEAWAMTETGAGAVVIAHEEPRHVGTACFGREAADVQVRIVREDGSAAAAEEHGELWVRHAGDNPRYGFFTAYLKDEAATDEAWAGDWFHTGDIVYRDAAGYLHFVDRKKNVIRRSGENIAAVEVEGVLGRHPHIKTAAVAAVPDALRGDEVLACVVLHSASADPKETAHDIVQYVLTQLAYYKAPGYVAFVDALPLTASQKIQRGSLRALAGELLEQGRCIDTRHLKKRQA